MRKLKTKDIVTIIVALIGLLASIISYFVGQSVQQQQMVNVFIDETGTENYIEAISILKNELADRKETAIDDRIKIADLETKNSTLTEKVSSLTADNKHLSSQVDSLSKDKNDLTTKNQSLNETINNLTNQNNELDSTNKSLREENDRLRKLCIDNHIDPDDIKKTPVVTGTGIALTELKELERNRDEFIITGSDAASKDDEGRNYSYGISCSLFDESSIEYRVDKKYKSLSGVLFITSYGASEYDGNNWEEMSFTIYADNREIFPGDTYNRPSYGKHMESIEIDLSIENATYIKFVFNKTSSASVSHSYARPLICFGNPKVYE